MYLIIPSSDPNLALTCLSSIEDRNPSFLNKTVIVTDEPDIFDGLLALYPNVIIQLAPKPFNFAKWTNLGIRVVYDLDESFMLLNDDTELLTDHGLSVLEQIVEREGSVPIISAAIRGTSGVIDQRQVTPSSIRLMPGHISFTAVAIHKSVFEEIGMLDERFVGYGHEDNDMCQRAINAGLAIGVYDGCVFNHYKPHSTFGRADNFQEMWLLGETIYLEKWSEPQDALVVVGGSRSGAAVYSAVVDAMGYTMPDKPASFESNVSAYFRDDHLARRVKKGEMGARNYVAGRDMKHKPHWGTRIWPQYEMAVMFLSAFKRQPRLLFVTRDTEARIRSYQMTHGVKYADAKTRVGIEVEAQERILAWARENFPPEKIEVVSYEALVEYPDAAVTLLAGFLGYDETLTVARDVVRPEYATFAANGEIYNHDAPEGFGKIAVGVRLTHPEASFVGCYARLLRQGLRDGDVLLEPAVRTPSHWAASTLMRRFLQSGCDTLLLLDDDMTFPPDLLEKMRDHEDNWRFDIVSALATQRVPPPRALLLRLGEQPDLPDALNGLYYNLLVDEVMAGETLPADGTGFAFTLIRRKVLEAMVDEEWGPGYTQFVQWGEGGEGEDVNFCRRAGSLGFRVAVDAGAHVGHVGSVVYGYDEFDQWRNSRTPTGMSADKLVELLESALPNLSGDELRAATALLKKARET